MCETGQVHTGFWWGGLGEKYHLEGPAADGRIILKRIFKKRDGEMKWLRVGHLAGSCKRGNEPSSAKECGEFLD